jgi:hypothetical protein
MPFVPLRNFGKYGVVADSQNQALPIGTWRDARNIRFVGPSFEKMLEPTLEMSLATADQTLQIICGVEVYKADNTFRVYVSGERAPYVQNSVLFTNPKTGVAVGFLTGSRPGKDSTSTIPDGSYVVSKDYGLTWTEYPMRNIPGNWYNDPSHPDWGSSYSNFTQGPHGMCLHSDGKFSLMVKGSGAPGTVYSTDGGVTWLRDNPLGLPPGGSQYSIVEYGGDVVYVTAAFTQCGTGVGGTNSAFFKASLTDLNDAEHFCIPDPTPGEAWMMINLGNRIFAGSHLNGEIIEWKYDPENGHGVHKTAIPGGLAVRHYPTLATIWSG